MIRKSFFALITTLVIFVSIALLYFTSQHVWQVEKHSVSIAVAKTPLSTPFYVAKSINAFEDTCVSVEYVDVVGGQTAFEKMMNGETDFGTSSDSVIAFQSLANKAFVTHAMFVQSDNDVKLITRASDSINSVIDLKGKRIGVTKATASEYFLSILLAIEGLTIKDVELYHYAPNQLTNSLINNEVDAIVPWEPFAFKAKELLNDKIKIHETKNLNTLTFNLISQHADNLLTEKATCVVEGLSTAIEYIAAHPEKAKRIMMDKLNLSSSYIDWVWQDYIFKLGLNQSLRLNIKSQASWAIESQMSEYSKIPDIDAYIDSRAMLQVDPRAVNIPL